MKVNICQQRSAFESIHVWLNLLLWVQFLGLDNFLSFSHYFNTGIDLRRIKAVSKFKSFVTYLNIAIIIFFLLLCTISMVS